MGLEPLASALRIRLPANAKYLPFRKLRHQEILRVVPFFPIPYHRVYAVCCYFCPRIGHLEIHFRKTTACAHLHGTIVSDDLREAASSNFGIGIQNSSSEENLDQAAH